MEQVSLDPWLHGLIYTLGSASLATWLALVVRRTERPLLRYEPREPVPWGWGGAVLALFFVASPIITSLVDIGEQPSLSPVSRVVAAMVETLLLTGVVVAAIAICYGATARDLGLPKGTRQWGWCVVIGLVAWLASLLPVQGTQMLLLSWLHTPSQHPLVKLVVEDRSPGLLAVAMVSAVVVASICEEITFRLLLQGWLEKVEDRALGWRNAVEPAEAAPEPTQPPRRGLLGLPYGWTPILVSSGLFGLAHWGHGTDPIPLVLLGVVLGYTYQRTHKVVPCIVTHMAFNLLSMAVLWRAIMTDAM